MIIGTVLLRLVPHVPNFAPITGMALFEGAYLNKKRAIIIPLLSMVISDYLLLYINPFHYPFIDVSRIYPLSFMFHSTTFFVYGSFILSGLIGIVLKKKKRTEFIIGASLIASLQFFIITNFGVWIGGMYSRGLDGLIESYIMGMPFFKWTLLGDLFYTLLFFGVYELQILAQKKFIINKFRFAL